MIYLLGTLMNDEVPFLHTSSNILISWV